jgi:hypothetical protein
MAIQIQLTAHAAARMHERLGVEQPQAAVQAIQGRLGSQTAHLGTEYDDGELCAFKLLYLPEQQQFAVLVVKSVMEMPGIVAFHVVKTVITTRMWEDKFGTTIKSYKFKSAARQRLTPTAFRQWVHEVYGANKAPNDNQLHVAFRMGTRRKTIDVKIRSAVCMGFRHNELVEDSLAHPGALTRVHETLARFGLRLEDRQFMRFDSEHGRLKMHARSARECPYCGMAPLPTDQPDLKARTEQVQAQVQVQVPLTGQAQAVA